MLLRVAHKALALQVLGFQVPGHQPTKVLRMKGQIDWSAHGKFVQSAVKLVIPVQAQWDAVQFGDHRRDVIFGSLPPVEKKIGRQTGRDLGLVGCGTGLN